MRLIILRTTSQFVKTSSTTKALFIPILGAHCDTRRTAVVAATTAVAATHSIVDPFRRQSHNYRNFTSTTTKYNTTTIGNSDSSPSSEDDRSSSSSLPDIRSYSKQYINGKWTHSTQQIINADQIQEKIKNAATLEVIDANTGRIVATVPKGTEVDTKKAIAAAKKALPTWKLIPVEQRMIYIQVFLQKFELHRKEIVNRTIVELGCTRTFANDVQTNALVGHTLTLLSLLGKKKDKNNATALPAAAAEFEFEYAAGKCTVVKEPVGVVGCITPWNYPLNQIALKVIPALLAGCTVVLKPSEVTPLVAYSIAEALHEAHLPPGVFNMVMGEGPDCGEILARHPDVHLVSFTGSTQAGQILTKVAADSGTMKPIKTELGGKSATLLLDDADYETVVPLFVKQLMRNTGQSCNGLSRMIAPAADYDKVVQLAAATMQEEIVDDSRLNPEATIGPLISQAQYDRVIGLIQKGIDEGATVVCGGLEKPTGLDDSLANGYFVQPTLFRDVTNDMTIAQTEIFGPVLCLIQYQSLEEGINIANDTPYGLNNAVASRDTKKALQVATQLQSGMVMINKPDMDLKAPFGGYKQSGNAREWGVSGLEEFLQTKTLNMELEEYRTLMDSSSYTSSTSTTDDK
mmetsp:Transcript_46505/g.52500  ORF Transcript_46505/g.52500 Transcript_46505/m.52500 type:complete len:632 (+) Transcript_46505:101-1996(+)